MSHPIYCSQPGIKTAFGAAPSLYPEPNVICFTAMAS